MFNFYMQSFRIFIMNQFDLVIAIRKNNVRHLFTNDNLVKNF